MDFNDTVYSKMIGMIPMYLIAQKLYLDGWRQSSSRYAILDKDGEKITNCGHALVKAVRKLERGESK